METRIEDERASEISVDTRSVFPLQFSRRPKDDLIACFTQDQSISFVSMVNRHGTTEEGHAIKLMGGECLSSLFLFYQHCRLHQASTFMSEPGGRSKGSGVSSEG